MSRRNYYDIFFLSMHFKGIEQINNKLSSIGERGYYIRRTNFFYLTCTKDLGKYNYIVDYYTDDGQGFNNSINIDDWMYLGRSGNIMMWREKNKSSEDNTFSLLSKEKIRYYNRKILKKDTRILSLGIFFAFVLSVFDIWSFMSEFNYPLIRNIFLIVTVGVVMCDIWFYKTIKRLLKNNKK